MTTEDAAILSQSDLSRYATSELSYIADDAYHWTLIEISDGKKVGYVKLHRNQYHHYSLEFVGDIPCPPELSGTWTMNNLCVRSLRDYCKDHGWSMSINHISKDGKTLSVNLKAI